MAPWIAKAAVLIAAARVASADDNSVNGANVAASYRHAVDDVHQAAHKIYEGVWRSRKLHKEAGHTWRPGYQAAKIKTEYTEPEENIVHWKKASVSEEGNVVFPPRALESVDASVKQQLGKAGELLVKGALLDVVVAPRLLSLILGRPVRGVGTTTVRRLLRLRHREAPEPEAASPAAALRPPVPEEDSGAGAQMSSLAAASILVLVGAAVVSRRRQKGSRKAGAPAVVPMKEVSDDKVYCMEEHIGIKAENTDLESPSKASVSASSGESEDELLTTPRTMVRKMLSTVLTPVDWKKKIERETFWDSEFDSTMLPKPSKNDVERLLSFRQREPVKGYVVQSPGGAYQVVAGATSR